MHVLAFRWAGIQALALLTPATAPTRLSILQEKARNDEDSYIRYAATEALLAADVPIAQKILHVRHALGDDDGYDGFSPRTVALDFIEANGPECAGVVPQLLEVMRDNDYDRVSVAQVLASIGGAATMALPQLRQYLEDQYREDPFGEEEEVKTLLAVIAAIENDTPKQLRDMVSE